MQIPADKHVDANEAKWAALVATVLLIFVIINATLA